MSVSDEASAVEGRVVQMLPGTGTGVLMCFDPAQEDVSHSEQVRVVGWAILRYDDDNGRLRQDVVPLVLWKSSVIPGPLATSVFDHMCKSERGIDGRTVLLVNEDVAMVTA